MTAEDGALVDRFLDMLASEAGAAQNTLAAYRNNAQAGGVTFGVNGIVLRGAGSELRVGDTVELTLRF